MKNSEAGKLAGKTVVVTGASSGIGRLAAIEFARQGANLSLIARSVDTLQALAEEIRKEGRRALVFPADVADPVAIQRAAIETAEELGGIDLWINNAASSIYAESWDTSLADTRRVMDVNFFGQVHGVLAALPYLRKSHGQIIAVLSVESEVGIPLHSAYTASKHALFGYYKVLHEELLHEGSGVKVSTILPASISTPFFEHSKTQLGVRPRPMPPVYSPEQVVHAMIHVALKPKFETVVGGAGRRMIFLQRRLPSALFRFISKIAYPAQKSHEAKGASEPNGLYQPMESANRVFGIEKPTPGAPFLEENRKYVSWALGAGTLMWLGWRWRTSRLRGPELPPPEDETWEAA